MDMGLEVVNSQLSLGKQLRQLTDSARTKKEIESFTETLKQAAENGSDHVSFDDLRDVLPIMTFNETVWDWLKTNELNCSGECDSNTGKLRYTISW